MVKLALPRKLEGIEDVESQIANDEGEMLVLCKAECNSENVWNCYSNCRKWLVLHVVKYALISKTYFTISSTGHLPDCSDTTDIGGTISQKMDCPTYKHHHI